MFDTKLRRLDYDRYNSLMQRKLLQFYATTSALHTVGFMYLSYFFRFRRLGLPATFLVAGAYAYFFKVTNNIAYKLIVDRNVINLARSSGHDKFIQPIGHFKNRAPNYV